MSSVAHVRPVRGLPASLHHDLQRAPATSTVPPDPPGDDDGALRRRGLPRRVNPLRVLARARDEARRHSHRRQREHRRVERLARVRLAVRRAGHALRPREGARAGARRHAGGGIAGRRARGRRGHGRTREADLPRVREGGQGRRDRRRHDSRRRSFRRADRGRASGSSSSSSPATPRSRRWSPPAPCRCSRGCSASRGRSSPSAAQRRLP